MFPSFIYAYGNSCLFFAIAIDTGTLDRLWKKMLASQAHDSLSGCVADSVAADIHQRAKEAFEIAKGIENLITKRIADVLELKANQVLVVNTDPTKYVGKKLVHIVSHSKNIAFEGSEKAVLVSEKFYPTREGVQRISAAGYDTITEKAYYELNVEIDVEVPAFGYKVIEFTETDKPLALPEIKEKQEISNDYYTLVFKDGKVILSGKDGREYEDFIRLTDIGNTGDTYDFSPADEEIELAFSKAYVEKDDFKQTLIVEGKSVLPVNLEEREVKDVETAAVTYRLFLSLNDSEIIEGKVQIDNQVLSHRMRLQIQTPDNKGNSIAQIQNGFIANSNIPIPKNWEKKYVEKPVNIKIFDKSVSAEGKNECLTVFADGIKECERVGDKLFITLFATTGELGKADLAWRPGRASGDTTNEGHIMMPTPLAQEIGKHEYTFAFRAVDKSLNQQLVAKTAYTRLTPSISYQRQMLNVFINRLDNKIWPLQNKLSVPEEISLLNIATDALVSAIYPVYFHKNHLVLRLANPTDNLIKVPKELIKRGLIVDALENEKPKISEIPPFDYISVLIDINNLSTKGSTT
ncbi:MAG: glycoside hydrolase family 38 C-terminal domain-containing protein [Micrococcaceae bacterium]